MIFQNLNLPINKGGITQVLHVLRVLLLHTGAVLLKLRPSTNFLKLVDSNLALISLGGALHHYFSLILTRSWIPYYPDIKRYIF